MNAPMLAATLATASQHDPPVSGGSKAGAILIGVAFLFVLYAVTALFTHHWKPADLVRGFDGFASTSKLQWFLWLIVILFSYVALWVLRAWNGDYSALSTIPVNLLTVLGFSTATAAAAKGITSGYVQTGKMTKPGAPAGAPAKNTGGIFQDDGGGPELAKIQIMGFTTIAIGVFLATVFHQIAIGDLKDSLPNIDSSLLVLMGISQGGYLGKKLVTFGTPALYPPSPESGPAGTKVTLTGANLGSLPGSQLMLNGNGFGATWLPTSIQLTVPDGDPATSADPATRAPWAGPFPQKMELVVSVQDQASNSVYFSVTGPRPAETGTPA
jgi:hypothetical protein